MNNYTHTITLPIIWLQQFDLKKGDKISLEIDDNKNLILKPAMEK